MAIVKETPSLFSVAGGLISLASFVAFERIAVFNVYVCVSGSHTMEKIIHSGQSPPNLVFFHLEVAEGKTREVTASFLFAQLFLSTPPCG